MSESGGMDNSYDPFGKDVAQAQLIVSMKIYDVLMALLMTADADRARDLDTAHSNGIILGLGPQFSHFFDRDDANSGETTESQPN